ncbi:MAG: amino acid adenylation domain-containing protein, partial [Anaerolineales bacterium]
MPPVYDTAGAVSSTCYGQGTASWERGWGEGNPEYNPDVPIDGDNLAYVLFTSGSTGRPKGVGIPHQGVRNRLLWMQERFGLDGTDAVLQKTPYTFDVSVWEFFWPLITGTRLIVAAPGDHKEPDRLVELIDRHGVTTLHFVPSMLSAFLQAADLDRCASLRRVILSGEALSAELQRRFFECTNAELHNLYGPTEASIDVTAWTCERNRVESSVPIGRPIANTQIYLLDDRLNPVPVGVAGELYIGGVQLARGYLNRPDSTAERFVPNPFLEKTTDQRLQATGSKAPIAYSSLESEAYGLKPGSRLYKTGDLARYRPGGAIEYLGRIDHQVKIRGFRIELGEIETRLKHHPGIREAVVVAREDSPGDKRLVAYLVGVQEPVPEVEALRAWLGEILPDYMVPAAFVHLERLPVTANGKLDRKALPTPDLSAQFAEHYVAPRNATEETLAKIWAEVLRVERVGIHDNFFELGGDSILSIQAVSQATQAGFRLSPRQLFQRPTIAALAQVAERVFDAKTDPDDVRGELPLTPIQRWFFHESWVNPDHWNQALLLEIQRPLEPRHLEEAMRQLVGHHDALRLRFVLEQGAWRQSYAEGENDQLIRYEDVSQTPDAEIGQAIASRAARHQAQLSLARGPLFRAVCFDAGARHPGWLLLIAHHLAVDAVSWRILLEDLDALCRRLEEGGEPVLPPRTTSYRRWALRLSEYAQTLAGAPQPPRPIEAAPLLPADYPAGANTDAESSTLALTLEAAHTRALVQETAGAYHTHVPELLLAALGQVIGARAGIETVLLDLEGHGRDHPLDDLDLTRTVGWFTTLFPVSLGIPRERSPGTLIKAVKEQVRCSAGAGFDYSVRSWLLENAGAAAPRAPILFNYLGHLDPADDPRARFRPVFQPVGTLRDPRNARAYEWEITAAITGGQLRLEWTYSTARYARATIERLAEAAMEGLKQLIEHCLQPEVGGLTPVDFPLARLSQEELDALPCDPRSVDDIYPLAPMQEGLLFHTLMHPGSGIYHMQDRYGIRGQVDVEAFREAWQRVLDRHRILRSGFVWEGLGSPHQVVYRRVALPFEFLDWRQFTQSEQESMLEELLRAERQQGFDLAQAPLMRIRLLRLAEERYRLIRSYHHILMDAWCTSLVLQDFKDFYKALRQRKRASERIVPPFKDYIAWLQRQDRAAAERFWREYLRSFTEATPRVVERPIQHPADGGEIGDQVDFLSEEDTAALNALAQRHRLTANTFVQAAWALLLSRYSRCEEVLFGVTVAGRPTDLPGIETVLGLFINSLPLRVRVHPGQRVLDFLRGLLQQNLDLRQYEHMPLVQIQALSDVPRGQPLFQHLLVFENTPLDPGLREDCAGLRLVDVETRTHTNYPITVVVIPGPRLHLQLTYERVRFEDGAIARMLGHFRCLLEGLIHQPQARLGELGMLTEAERRAVFFEWNQTAISKSGVSDFSTLFEAQVSRTPEAVAVACGGEQLTYREINTRANRIAHALIAGGVGPDVLVALVDERGIDLLVAILAVFKAGGAYLPLDPAYPEARIEHIIELSRAALVIAGPSCSAYIREAVNAGDGPKPPVVGLDDLEAELGAVTSPLPSGGARDLAYVIYTSGSTGAPKGAMVERAGMLNNLLSKISELNLGPQDVIAQTASQCFDISVWQFLTGLVCGARVEIIANAVVQDPGALLD